MSRARATHRLVSRTVALTLALGLTLPLAGPTLAADPTPPFRPDRPAWDHPTPASTSDLSAETGQRLIVRFRPGATAGARRRATAGRDVARVVDLPAIGMAVVRATGDPDATIAAIETDPSVIDVSLDGQSFRDADPQDEQAWSELWGLDNTGQRLYQGEPGTEGRSNIDIDSLQAYGVQQGDPNVVVAVIDDGVDFDHPDLAGQAWTNPGESGDGKETNGVDDDGNGYIDDVNGWDFCDNDNTVHDFDDDFHGTHVAGTIASKLDGVGTVGVAPGVRIMALKFIANHKGCGFDVQAIEAINYAKSFGVRIANSSWGSRRDPARYPALRSAIAASGMLFVASAGNEGINNDKTAYPVLPASFNLPNILSVAAVDNEGRLASFSNYGAKTVDIAGPGSAILSALPADSTHVAGWGWLDGTSMAAPHVSGVAALVASADAGLGADPVALRARLLASGKSLSKTAGKTATGRIVDAFRALDFVPPVAAAPSGAGFVKNSTLGKSSATARVSWPVAIDEMTAIDSYRVGVQVDGGAWATQVSSTTSRTNDRTMAFGRTYAFRVRARDLGGNWGTYADGPTVRASRFQESSSLATYAGTWATSKNASWSGGRTRYARKAGASVTFQFTGRAFAIVAQKGPTRGTARLYVDDLLVGTVDLHRSSSAARVLVATRTWTSSAAHTVRLVVVGTTGHPRVDVDAFLVMR